jgi:uncharacterized protein (DUF433 family)
MGGTAIMALNALLQLSGPVCGYTMLPTTQQPPTLVFTVTNGDFSRFVSTAEINAFPFLGQYFRSDVGPPLSITVSSAHRPLIPGTRVPVYKISALIDGGLGIDDVMEDYPSLTRQQIESAFLYAKVNPNPGAPYPNISFKRALRGMDLFKYLQT